MSYKQYKKRFRKRSSSLTMLHSVVTPEAIDDYLKKTKGKNWNWIKSYSQEQLFDRVDWSCGFEFYTKPYLHQAQCFYLGIRLSSFFFYLDMGAGKTKLMLDIFRYRKARGQVEKMLVMVQDVLATDTWVEQIQLHAPDLKYVQLVGAADDRFRAIKEEYDVALVNYHGLQVLLCDWEEIKDKKVKRDYKRTINQNLVDNFKLNHDMMVLDEIQTVTASGTSLNYELCKLVTDEGKYVYGLTGTPFGRDPFPVYHQYRLVDAGETFGETPAMFRSVFYKRIRKPWAVVFEFDQRMADDFNVMLLARSIRYEEKEFSDLPPITYIPVTVRKQEDIEPFLIKLRKEIEEIDFKGSNCTAHMSTIYYRARALTAGYACASIKDADGEVVDKVVARFKNAPKIAALVDLIKKLPLDEKIVVFHVYIESGNIIMAALKEEKIKCSQLRGTHIQRKEALEAFKYGSSQVLVTSAAIGSTGLNLQKAAHYVAFFETPSDPKQRKQAEKRVHRSDQEHRVFVYDLVMKGTIDEKILERLRTGSDFFTLLMDGRNKKGSLL